MIHGILVKDGTITEVDLEDELDVFYEKLDCDMIDIVVRKIGNKAFNIVCDEEGLFHDGPISMMDSVFREPMLVGSLFICNSNGGELTSLSADDVAMIKANWHYRTLWGSYA